MTASWSRVEQHPDILALQAESERATATWPAQMVEGLSLLAGLYLAGSAWIVGFDNVRALAVNNLIAGIGFALLAVGFGSPYERTHGMSWAALGLGVWTIIAPWVVSGQIHTTRIIASNVAVGAAMVCLALATAAMGARRRATTFGTAAERQDAGTGTTAAR